MRLLPFAAAGLAALCASALPSIQTRAAKPEVQDFPAVLARAQDHYEANRYAAAMADLKTCVGLTQTRWVEAIREALPAAPENWTKVPQPKDEQESAQAQAMLASLSLGVGTQVEQRYTAESKRLDVSITADSPMVGMMGMMFSNPAMLNANQELIEYGTHKAILDTSNSRGLDLQILIANKHLIQVTCPEDDEFLFAMFDQAAIDRLAAALGT